MSGFVNESNAGRPGDDGSYGEVIKNIREGSFCPFCPDHLHETHPNPILSESEHWLTTENAWPYEGAREHLLIIHKEHIETLGEMSIDAWQDLQLAIKGIAKVRDIEGAALLMRFGDTRFTGASVAHLHAQLVSGPGEEGSEPVLARVG